mgnify:FL=1
MRTVPSARWIWPKWIKNSATLLEQPNTLSKKSTFPQQSQNVSQTPNLGFPNHIYHSGQVLRIRLNVMKMSYFGPLCISSGH